MKKISLLLILLILISFSSFAQKDTIHVVFKTHLDIGFTDLAQNVIDTFMNDFIPKALKTARIVEKNGTDKFIWTTGSWLINEFLKTATPEKKAEMESAIRDGLIVWNGYPFTFQSEILNGDMLKHALSISHDLDLKYGKKTITAKITDVMGETIGVLNQLNSAGIRMLHIGTNASCIRPATPPVFLWKDQHDNEVIVIYENTYGKTTVIPGFNHILHFAFTGDNRGPQTPEQIKKVYSDLRSEYPDAIIMASTMDNYAKKLLRIKNKLPIITAEIGSTWIHSAGTDPKKYASLRALMRLHSRWLVEKRVNPSDRSFLEFSTNLLLGSEHTGGLSEVRFLGNYFYNQAELAQVLNWPVFQTMMQSWNDSREYIQKAIDALGNSPLRVEAQKELNLLTPIKPSPNKFDSISLITPIETKYFKIQFDSCTGAIVSLFDRNKNSKLTDIYTPFGLFWHESFSEEDYKHWLSQYMTRPEREYFPGFDKPNINSHGAVSAKHRPQVKQAFLKTNEEDITVLLLLQFQDTRSTNKYGLPAEIWLKIDFPSNRKEINYTVQWFNKKPCRLPEAYWFSMGFAGFKSDAWRIEKIDGMISPLDVISKGGRSLHGFNRGVFYNDGRRKIFIESLDCPIVAPGEPALLDFNDKLPDLSKGWHFNLFNNKWATNFPTWYSDDAKFRFTIRID